MRRHEFFFWLIRIPLEVCLVILAFWVARDLRISIDLLPVLDLPTYSLNSTYLIFIALFSYVILGTIFAFQHLYSIDRMMGVLEEIFTVIKSVCVWFFVMIGIIYLTNGFPYNTILIPRLILIYAFTLTFIFIIIERIIIRHIRLYGIRKKWFATRKILLVMHHGDTTLETLLRTDDYIDIVWYMSPVDQWSHFRYLGSIWDHALIIKRFNIEDVIVLSHDLPYEFKKNLFEYCQIYGIRYRYVGNLYETTKHNAYIDFIGRVPFVEIRTIGLTAWWRVIKRIFDILVSSFLLLLLIPMTFFVSLIIMLESPGKPLYQSRRVGRNGFLFPMLKFRSMIRDAEQRKQDIINANERVDGPLFKITKDPRVTRFGRFIRSWSLDELPQIFNVFVWDMSFIWPRPHLPEEVEKYSDKQRQVLTIKPWITGMAQVYGRDTNTFDREIELDLFYIENWSLLLDTKIFLLTFRAIFQGK